MKIYLVGGAVRDKLLGLPVKERDWVVVGATVAEMTGLGYQLVGKDFPVFLHPKTKEEYALARMERKVKPGYKGFEVDTSKTVTLEEDLIRRDLTINAMAESEKGELVDPYGGKKDLDAKILRHVSKAFAEDPVRILRVGRFLARYAYLGFHVADETIALMQQMVAEGEVDALVSERVWKEFERALCEKNPEKFFEVLAAANALHKLFPNLSVNGLGMQALHAATLLSTEPMVRFAALVHDLPDPQKNIADICNRYRAPNHYRELALLTAKLYESAFNAKSLSAEALLQLFSSLDIFRRQERFQYFLQTCKAIAKARQLSFDDRWLSDCAEIAKSYDVQELVTAGLEGNALAAKLKEKRIEKIAAWLAR